MTNDTQENKQNIEDSSGTVDPFKIQGSIGGNIIKTKYGTNHFKNIANIRWAKEGARERMSQMAKERAKKKKEEAK